MDSLQITIDQSNIERYAEHYFTLHPKAKKLPIDAPYHPSINKWMIMKRPMMNGVKQKWKDFIVWLVHDLGYSDLKIERCRITCTTYYKTRLRHDVDNSVPKFILDGLVDAGLLVDDDSLHLVSLTLECAVDKANPRTEIVIIGC